MTEVFVVRSPTVTRKPYNDQRRLSPPPTLMCSAPPTDPSLYKVVVEVVVKEVPTEHRSKWSSLGSCWVADVIVPRCDSQSFIVRFKVYRTNEHIGTFDSVPIMVASKVGDFIPHGSQVSIFVVPYFWVCKIVASLLQRTVGVSGLQAFV